METIRNYLASMFANLPNTLEVQKARAELEQMMEDKYQELLQEGRTENEAVGVVISEFGNLDELAETLGIQNVIRSQVVYSGRTMGRDEVQSFLHQKEKVTLLRSLGVLLCIISPTVFLFAETIVEGAGVSENVPLSIATGLFFLIIAIAVGIFVFTALRMEKWSYLKKENIVIDQATAEYLHTQKEANHVNYAIMKTIGVILCIVCFIPVTVIGALNTRTDVPPMIGAILLFLIVGIGVMLLINASGKEEAYRFLLKLNDRNTMSGHYVPSQGEETYTNETVSRVMDVYWPTVLAIYLCWSFLTSDWHISWIIWPIAGIAKHWVRAIWGERGGQDA